MSYPDKQILNNSIPSVKLLRIQYISDDAFFDMQEITYNYSQNNSHIIIMLYINLGLLELHKKDI